MSLIPGATGNKSVFPDGLQSDHLSENTVGHGVRVKGISDPTTYPVLPGDVGETIEVTQTNSVTGSTTLLTYTTLVTLNNLSTGKWRITASIPYISIIGVANDTGTVYQGVLARIRVLKNNTTEICNTVAPGLAKSTVNSGYLVTGVILEIIEVNTASTDSYALQFTAVGNSGSPTITGLSASGATGTIYIRATRIA